MGYGLGDGDSGDGLGLHDGGGLGLGTGNGNPGLGNMGGGSGLTSGGVGEGGWGGGWDGDSNYSLWGSPNWDFGGGGGYDGGGYDLGSMFSGGGLGLTKPDRSYSDNYSPDIAPETPTWDGMIGLNPAIANKTGLGLDGDQRESGFMDSEFGKRLRAMGLWAARQNPNTNKALGAFGVANALNTGNYGQALGAAAGLAGAPGPVGGLLGLGVDAMNGKPVQDQVAGLGLRTIAGGLGTAVAGPVGGLALGQLAGWAADQPRGPQREANPYAGGSNRYGNGDDSYVASPEVQRAIDSIKDPVKKAEAQRDPVGAILGGLMGLYGINRMKNTAEGQRRAIQQQQEAQKAQIDALLAQIRGGKAPSAPAMRQPNFDAVSRKLDSMFGPKSGAAAELRTQLERKDAAAGRRSQYGPREVQLLSELTRLRAQAEPGYMNAEVAAANAANQGAFNIYNSQQQARQQQIQQLLAGLNISGSGAANAQNALYAAQQASDQRTQQTLATLYGMGQSSGAFSWLGNQFQDWWNNGD